MIVVHIGLKKSGSASIQDFFFKHDEALRSISIDFPLVGRERRKFLKNGSLARGDHHSFAWEAMDRGKFDARFGTIADLAEHARTSGHGSTIISSEMFEGCEPDQARKLVEGLSTAGQPIRIVLVIRDLVSLMQSSYAQKVRYGLKHYNFDKFFEERMNVPRVNYFDTAKVWSDIVGWENMEILLLDRNFLINGDLIDEFLAAAGVDLNDPLVQSLPRPPVTNEASGWKILEANRAIYKGDHGLEDDHPMVRFAADAKRPYDKKRIEVAAIEVGNQLGWVADKGRYLTRPQAQHALEIYHSAVTSINENVARKIPLPLDLDARGFIEREFLPNVSRIPRQELQAYYDAVGDRLVR